MKVVIALGSNLGDSRAILDSAVESLKEFITVSAVSTYIETEPVGGPEQPNYLNAVLIGECELLPNDVMKRLLAIEADAGRVRVVRWGARTLDLDFISADQIMMDSELLTLPHPRAHERVFVLAPWLEIDPDGGIPGKGRIDALLAQCEEHA